MSQSPREEFSFLLEQLKHRLSQGESRLGHWKKRHPPAAPTAPVTDAPPAPLETSPPPETLSPPGSIASAVAPQSLEELREQIGDCQICPLGATRQKLVFGVGNPKADVLFVGEGPGFMEDRQGEPFVGPAGQLLDKILGSIGLSRKQGTPDWQWVYIANIVKCHPMVDPAQPDKRGNDRPPSPEESETCLPFLRRQIALIEPRFIVTLGATAAKIMLNTSQGITRLRGQWADYQAQDGETIRLLPTYHPAALLRNVNLKKPVWEDMKTLRDALQKIHGSAAS